MIDILLQAALLFVLLLKYTIYLDVILSWLTLLGINIVFWPIRWILDPLYGKIEAVIPTHFSGISFTPIVLLLGLFFLEAFLRSF